MLEILRNTETTLSTTLYVDEAATNATGTVNVYVYRDNGSLAVSGAATAAGSGAYTYDLAPQTNLDILSITWTGTLSDSTQSVMSELEVVDSHFATIAEIRGLDSMDDESKFSTNDIVLARRHAERWFERYCRRAFVPRYAKLTVDGDGSDTIWVPQRDLCDLIDITVDGSTISTDDIYLYPEGKVFWDGGTFTVGYRNVVLRYEYGPTYVPQPIRGAFLTYVRYLLIEGRSRTPDRTVSINADGFLYQMGQAGPNKATGIPDVDAVLNEYRAANPFNVGRL